MPMYEYICLSCEHPFEVLVPATAGEPGCPACGSERTRKRLSMFATSGGAAPSYGAGSGGTTGGGCCGGGGCGCGR